jgi:putative tricarboxylic transport membrane protein
VLGLVIAPTFELSLRQSLIMSNGNWAIFLNGQRPIATALMALCGVLLALSALSWLSRRDWRKGIEP